MTCIYCKAEDADLVDGIALCASCAGRFMEGSALCIDCGRFPADPPSRLCPGCQAYEDHLR